MRILLFLSLALGAFWQTSEKPQIQIPALERRIHDGINAERDRNNVTPALRWDDALAAIARNHSADMVKRKFFDHVNPDDRTPIQRATAAGYRCRKDYADHFTEGVAENIHQGNLYSAITITGAQKKYDWLSADQIAREAVEGWMKSPGHRQNILQGNYDRAGIGVAIAPDDKVYITQLFC